MARLLSLALALATANAGLQDGTLLLYNSTLMAAARRLVLAGDPRVMPAFTALSHAADERLTNLSAYGAFSVMNKSGTAPSGDKHDYISLSEYYWPCTCNSTGPLDPPHCPSATEGVSAWASITGDAAKPKPSPPCNATTGAPFVRHDGWLDPLINDFDFTDLTAMWDFSTTLALAYFYAPAGSKREEYGAGAARVLKAWFVSSATKMSPNMQYAQVVPGVYPDGQHSGVIDGNCHLPYVFDALTLISGSPAWSAGDNASVTKWVRDYTKWLVNSTAGRNESAQEHNNHESWYIVGAAAGALWVGDLPTASYFLRRAPSVVVGGQVALNGSLPYELARTRSLFYTDFALHAMLNVATLTQLAGLDSLWDYASPGNGTSLRRVVDFLVPYVAGEPRLPWPFPQVDPPGTAPYSSGSLYDVFLRAASEWRNSSYSAWASALEGDHSTDISTLLWAQQA